MSSMIYSMLSTAKSALATQQKALDITANNIANVNTEGYSRQRLNIEQERVVSHADGTVSSNVRASPKIQRIHDRFLTAQINDAASKKGRWEAQRETLEKAELMFDDASGYGLNDAMAQFWNDWQKVSNNPSGYTERATLLGDAENLTHVFNKLSRDLTQVQQDSDASVVGTVEDINALTRQIAALNLQVAEVELGNVQSANQIRDQRDLKLKELSSLIEVNSFEDADGYLTISTTKGHPLVDRSSSRNLVTANNTDGFKDIFWESSSGNLDNITTDISTGKLKGWIEARDTIITDYHTRLDDMAVAMAGAVNGQHHSGLDLNGDAGLDFFSPATSAADIAVNSAIAGDTNLIAAALDDPDPLIAERPPGGNGNAIAMAGIQNRLLMAGATSTMDDFYNGLVSDAGRFVYQAQVNGDHQSSVALQLDTYREEVSGVSMDEEMINLVQFQSAYTAAAKLVTAVDEMLQTVLSLV